WLGHLTSLERIPQPLAIDKLAAGRISGCRKVGAIKDYQFERTPTGVVVRIPAGNSQQLGHKAFAIRMRRWPTDNHKQIYVTVWTQTTSHRRAMQVDA